MKLSKSELQAEALSRATSGRSLTNWPAIFAGFTAKGIPESDILPRVNVLTYHAWRAAGRQVRAGEHGVKVVTWVSPKDKAEAPADGDEPKKTRPTKMPWTAVVFHVSQTDPIA